MDLSTDLLRETALYIESYFKLPSAKPNEHFHFASSLKLVQTCTIISEPLDLSKQDRLTILLAAWFLYTGADQNPENDPAESAEQADHYFSQKGLASDIIKDIREIILATRFPQQPLRIPEQILCDADNSMLADKTCYQRMRAWEGDRLEKNIQKLENHIYFTAAARKLFDKNKEKNILFLKEMLAAKGYGRKVNSGAAAGGKVKDEMTAIIFDDQKLERGVETLFRNTARNQIHLIRLADYKANLIITINSIIISVVLSILIVRLDANQYLELPTLLLILTNVITILIAISATRPKTSKNAKRMELNNSERNNLLYYGIFYKIPLEEFNRFIKKTIIDRNDLYDSLVQDIYHQGIILFNKFRQINLAYTVFIVGLMLSILAFIFSFLKHIHSI